MTLTPKESHRLHVLTMRESARLTSTQAAEALGLTLRRVRRLRRTLSGPGRGSYGARRTFGTKLSNRWGQASDLGGA
jgi:hypothetical protein